MSTDAAGTTSADAARIAALVLEAVTAVGGVAGIQGFLSGTFDPLVDQLHDAWPLVQGRVLPAVALGAFVALPQAVALGLGLRRHQRAGDAALAVGVTLTVWVAAQLPLIGLESPVQWAFLAVGVAEVVAAIVWRRGLRRIASGPRRRATGPMSRPEAAQGSR